MFMLGFALLGSTLLLPLFMQTMLGYTAEQSGMALCRAASRSCCCCRSSDSCCHAIAAVALVFWPGICLASLFHMTDFNLGLISGRGDLRA